MLSTIMICSQFLQKNTKIKYTLVLRFVNICNLIDFILLFNPRVHLIRRTDHATRLYPQKLALTSPTSGGRSVGIVRSRTKATDLVT
jgi:hypothetical protein